MQGLHTDWLMIPDKNETGAPRIYGFPILIWTLMSGDEPHRHRIISPSIVNQNECSIIFLFVTR